jgi:dTDP-4-dehydrorhamnose reductase
LVTGASGFLGGHVARALRARGEPVVGTSTSGSPLGAAGWQAEVPMRALSLDDGGAAAARLVAELRPRAVVHLAALAAPGVCAQEPDRARVVNAQASGALAAAAEAAGARFLFTSTDLVFDGTAAPYREEDPPAPLGVYMESKAQAEVDVLSAAPGGLVVRVALVYGLPCAGGGGGFMPELVRRLQRGEPSRLFTDQVRTPVEVGDAAALLCDLLAAAAGGIVHLGGPERVSRHAHGAALAEALGASPDLCEPIRMADLAGLSPRPADASLVSDRLVALTGRTALGVAAGCARAAAAARGGAD